jgi:hypothetical protein
MSKPGHGVLCLPGHLSRGFFARGIIGSVICDEHHGISCREHQAKARTVFLPPSCLPDYCDGLVKLG